MKKLTFVIPILAVLALIYWGYSTSSKEKRKSGANQVAAGFNGQVYLQFESLPDGVVAQSGDYQVLKKEILNSAPMKTFRNKKRDILFAIIYKQFVSYSSDPVEKIEFSFKKVSRSPNAILSQYGVPVKHTTEVKFQSFDESKGLAKVDGRLVKKSEIDFNNFIWAAFDTEIFRFKLSEIDKVLKRKVISGESKKLNLTTQDYQKKYIFDKLIQEISDNDINAYMKKYNMDDTERNRQSASSRLLEQRRRRGIDYILEKYVMDLPVKVNLTPPNYQLEAKAEWTPVWGGGDGLEMTLFSDTKNSNSVELLSGIFDLFEKYEKINFRYRPVFFESDRLQKLTTQTHFCVLMSEPDKFWDFFRQTLGDFRDQTEAKLYQVSDEMGLDTKELKQCLVKKQFEEVVDYHLKYAEYIGIQAGPVLYIGGEVLHGAIRLHDVEKIIQRKLNVRAAGVW